MLYVVHMGVCIEIGRPELTELNYLYLVASRAREVAKQECNTGGHHFVDV